MSASIQDWSHSYIFPLAFIASISLGEYNSSRFFPPSFAPLSPPFGSTFMRCFFIDQQLNAFFAQNFLNMIIQLP